MTAADRIWIGAALIVLGTAAAALDVPILPSSAPIGFGIGTLLYGVIQLRRTARRADRSEEPVTTVEINAGGRYVRIQQDGRDVETLLPLAEQAWKATDGAKHESDGPAFGFQAERRGTPPAQPSGMRWAPGPYPIQAAEDPTRRHP